MENYQFESLQEDKKSKYNSAIAVLYRIDALWKDAHNHRRNSQLHKLNLDLDAVWLELSEDAKPEDIANFEMFNKGLVACGFFIVGEQKGFTNVSQEVIINQAKFYQILLQKEMWLRKLQNKQGKSAAYADALDEYMD